MQFSWSEKYSVGIKEEDAVKLAKEIHEFATAWLANHILFVDKQYTECFLKHGLK